MGLENCRGFYFSKDHLKKKTPDIVDKLKAKTKKKLREKYYRRSRVPLADDRRDF